MRVEGAAAERAAIERAAIERARAAYLAACELDVAVRKPGNVSRFSAGHGMQAELFSASARASVTSICRLGARVGDRIEGAVAATADVAGCNTNLGIVLLCAPVARAIELHPDANGPVTLHAAVGGVLADLDIDDARAAYRAIARAKPGGLGSAPTADVHELPDIDLRAAMALAADRDSIARQYRDGYADLFALDLASLAGLLAGHRAVAHAPVAPELRAAVQRLYLGFVAGGPDSHIVRKHGAALAHSVMRSAQPWLARAEAGEPIDADPALTAWDEELKAAGLNPGTSADFTVAALFIAGIVGRSAGLP